MKYGEYIISLFAGVLFGFGLSFSEMVNPARVIGFLDITGNWDPTLLLVMVGALSISLPFTQLIVRQNKPLLSDRFSLPKKSEIDLKLIAGAVLFGLGWGMAGFCPGPAIAGLITLSMDVLIFVAAMFAGFYIANKLGSLS